MHIPQLYAVTEIEYKRTTQMKTHTSSYVGLVAFLDHIVRDFSRFSVFFGDIMF